MKSYFVTFRSVTHAQRAESMLRRGGIGCMLRRTPRWMEEQGCGYCLRLGLPDIQAAVELLRKNQAPFRKIYLVSEQGDAQEVAL